MLLNARQPTTDHTASDPTDLNDEMQKAGIARCSFQTTERGRHSNTPSSSALGIYPRVYSPAPPRGHSLGRRRFSDDPFGAQRSRLAGYNSATNPTPHRPTKRNRTPPNHRCEPIQGPNLPLISSTAAERRDPNAAAAPSEVSGPCQPAAIVSNTTPDPYRIVLGTPAAARH